MFYLIGQELSTAGPAAVACFPQITFCQALELCVVCKLLLDESLVCHEPEQRGVLPFIAIRLLCKYWLQGTGRPLGIRDIMNQGVAGSTDLTYDGCVSPAL